MVVSLCHLLKEYYNVVNAMAKELSLMRNLDQYNFLKPIFSRITTPNFLLAGLITLVREVVQSAYGLLAPADMNSH